MNSIENLLQSNFLLQMRINFTKKLIDQVAEKAKFAKTNDEILEEINLFYKAYGEYNESKCLIDRFEDALKNYIKQQEEKNKK